MDRPALRAFSAYPPLVNIDESVRAAARIFAGGRPLRLAYIPGPGDVYGTFLHWRRGEDDPRAPIVAYSTQFYELCRAFGAEALILHRFDARRGQSTQEGSFRFVHVDLPDAGGGGVLDYWRAKEAFTRACARRIRSFRPDITIVGGDFFWPLAPFLRGGRDGRLILSIHNAFWSSREEPRGLKAVVLNHGKRAVIRLAVDGAIAVSQECQRQFDRLSGGKASSDNWVIQCRKADLERFGPVSGGEREEADPPERIMAFVGRITEDKGVFDLLAAFQGIAAKHEDARLVFAGDGPALEALKQAVAASPFAGRITCPGRLDGDAVHRLLGEAAFLVCPTRSSFLEGFAAVCIEALLHGAPSVTSSVVPAAEFLGPAAAVFPADDVGALTTLLDELLSDTGRLAALRGGALERRKALAGADRCWGAVAGRMIGKVLA